MIKRLFKILFISSLLLAFITGVATAQDGDDSQGKDRPPGWEKGKKEGWQSDEPPGQEEKEKKPKKIAGDDEASDGEKLRKEKKEQKEKKAKKDKQKKKKKKKSKK